MDLSSSSIVVKRVLDALGDTALVLAAVRLDQRARRQARGMQRLQQIVADGGEEAGLEAIGALGGIARGGQLVVGALEPRERVGHLLGAQAHLPLEGDGGLEQGIGVRLLRPSIARHAASAPH